MVQHTEQIIVHPGTAVPGMYDDIHAHKSARFACLNFSIAVRQSKILHGIHGDSFTCDSIEWKDRRFRPRLVGAVLEAWKAEYEEWKACQFS